MKNLMLVLVAIIFFGCNSNAQKKESQTSQNFKVAKTDQEWKTILSSEEYAVLRNAATEPPHSSELDNVKVPGTFVCAGCGNELYKTKHKFDSGTGWPSFDRPIEGAVSYGADTKLGYQRDEVHCADCGGHLGHVFDDGPGPTGLRYCVNSLSLDFKKEE